MTAQGPCCKGRLFKYIQGNRSLIWCDIARMYEHITYINYNTSVIFLLNVTHIIYYYHLTKGYLLFTMIVLTSFEGNQVYGKISETLIPSTL